MASTSKNPKGRPPAKILTDHFKQLDKVDNKSNRWYYECNYCGSNPPGGARIEGRDNKPIKHLIDPKKCPNAPQSVRNVARTYLAAKSSDVLLPEMISEAAASPSTDDGAIVTAPKRQRGTLLGFADVALTPAQQDRANVKLFRAIVHANIPFSVVENWYFRNFLDEIRPSYNAPSRYVI
ncbi:hypothetical protein BV22DRAFT_1024864, partial [Leucogyrophana mollusca]